MQVVLLDTGALFASLDSDDPNHYRARTFMAGEAATYVVPDTVFSEMMTLVKLHLGSRLAIEAGRAVLAGAPFRIHYLSADDHRETWRIFSRYTDKEWSYVDCSILALARRLRVHGVFAFDHHVDQMSSLSVTRLP